MKYNSDYDYDSDSSDGSDSGMAFVINNYASNSTSPCTIPEEYEDWQVQPWMSPVTGRFNPNQSALVPMYSGDKELTKKTKFYKPKPPSPVVKAVKKMTPSGTARTAVPKTSSPAAAAPKRMVPRRSSEGCQWCGTAESSLWRKHPQHGTICTACYASNRRWGEIRRPRAVVAERTSIEPSAKKARLGEGFSDEVVESPKSVASVARCAQRKSSSTSSITKLFVGPVRIPKGSSTPSGASDSSLTLNEGTESAPLSPVLA